MPVDMMGLPPGSGVRVGPDMRGVLNDPNLGRADMGGLVAARGSFIPSSQVVALFRMDGSQAVFTDQGPNAFKVTAAGAATQTPTLDAFGGGKALICATGTADYIDIAGSALLMLTDFTVNMRVQFDNNTFSNVTVLDIGGFDVGLSLRANGSATDRMTIHVAGTQSGPAITWVANRWYELEVSRLGINVYCLLDGALIFGPLAYNTTPWPAAPALRIGRAVHTDGSQNAGRKFDDVLITNTCLHTASYTPRTAQWIVV